MKDFLIDTLFFIFMIIIAVGIVTAVYDLFIGIDTERVAGVISRDGNE